MNGWGLPNPGDTLSVEMNGQVHTARVGSVSYRSGGYVPAPELSRWRKMLRIVTPKRWRKPLPMGYFESPTVSVRTEGMWDRSPVERAQKNIAASLELAERLSKGI